VANLALYASLSEIVQMILMLKNNNLMKKRLAAILTSSLVLTNIISNVAGQSSAAQSASAVSVNAKVSDADLQRQQTFEQVWNTVNEKHFDPTFGGVDWKAVRAKYEPRVSRVKTNAELYRLLEEMLGELKQSHFHIIPIESFVEGDTKEEDKSGIVGLELCIVEGRAIITRVEQDSPAARAGLRPGFSIEAIGNQSVTKSLARIKQALTKRSLSQDGSDFIAAKLLAIQLSGPEGTSVRVSFTDAKNRIKFATLKRAPDAREFSPQFGNFPPRPMEFESRRLANGIGYIRFNIWVMPQFEKVRAAIRREMKDAPGIIFDARDNPGGIGALAAGVAGHLFQKEASLGKMQMRSGFLSFPVFPQPQSYAGPIVVLIDYGSASTSEIFAAGLQESGRAKIVGQRSHGAALPSFFERLPLPAIFQYAIADYRTPKGVLVEGRGVTPDVEVKLTRADLLAGRDTQLEAAISLLQKQIVNNK
jgi:carboxyl-terminal processing protease